MALFTLTDIKFKSDKQINKLPIISDIYRRDTLRYPEDIGEVDKGHYMVIHINIQDRTNASYKKNLAEGEKATIQTNRAGVQARTGYQNFGGLVSDVRNLFSRNAQNNTSGPLKNALENEQIKNTLNSTQITSQINSSIGIFKQIGQTIGGAANGVMERVGTLDNLNFARPIKRVKDTIALYMPDTLLFQQKQHYDGIEMGEEIGSYAAAGASMLKNFMASGQSAAELGKNLSPFVANALKETLGKGIGKIPGIGQGTATTLFYTMYGTVNPKMELIYTKPEFRSFSFQFMFYPRNEQEALEVQRIIQKLKFHQAPELDKGTAGFFLVPPSEFDIQFYYNGKINPNIPKISTCVLKSIDLDYAPNGFVAYESPDSLGVPQLGKTGMPVAISMRLDFEETEIMTKYNFEEEPVIDDRNELRTRR